MASKESQADWIEDVCKPCAGTGKIIETHKVERGGQPKSNPPACPVCGSTGRAQAAREILLGTSSLCGDCIVRFPRPSPHRPWL
jgi:DnaJ-class molecular chaperone